MEAESFAPDKDVNGWNAQKCGENFYAFIFANTFLSRKAFLGAWEQAQSTASIETEIKEAATD